MEAHQAPNLKNFSDRRLWELLRQMEQPTSPPTPMQPELLRLELQARGHQCEQNRWRAPH